MPITLEEMGKLDAYEVGNGLLKWISLKRSVSLVKDRDLITTLTRIFSMNGFSVIGFRDLNQSAILDLAVENNITFYDACYIMASVIFKVPLVTEDDKLKKVAAKYVRVLSWRDV